MLNPEVERCNKHGREFHIKDGCPECLELHLKRQEAVFKQVRYAVAPAESEAE